jgi:hypothetical protein
MVERFADLALTNEGKKTMAGQYKVQLRKEEGAVFTTCFSLMEGDAVTITNPDGSKITVRLASLTHSMATRSTATLLIETPAQSAQDKKRGGEEA